MSSPSNPTIYLAYGSNLSLSRIAQRCPHATYLGVARLPHYTWLINSRGYANIAPTTPTPSNASTDAVFSLVYALSSSSEQQLDRDEGVPSAYTKALVQCEFWSAGPAKAPLGRLRRVDVSGPPAELRDVLVYIDRERTAAGKPRGEYVVRMNRGIRDAGNLGVPRGYIDEVLRKYIAEGTGGGEGRGRAGRLRDG